MRSYIYPNSYMSQAVPKGKEAKSKMKQPSDFEAGFLPLTQKSATYCVNNFSQKVISYRLRIRVKSFPSCVFPIINTLEMYFV